jgi:anti-sigma regulatory factor (Ser/Thr protein kinase)
MSRSIGDKLTASGIPMEYAAGHADAMHRLRMRAFGIVITNPASVVDEDLALLEEMRQIRPGVRCIILTPQSTPDEVIAALRARVYACFSAPFDLEAIVDLAANAASDSEWRDEIQVITARPGWVSVRANCHLLTAERLLTFARELNARMPSDTRQEMLQALREILLNAMEHGAAFNPQQLVEITAVRTARTIVFYVRDPGSGFRRGSLNSESMASPLHEPMTHIITREEEGMRPGGYGLLLAGGTVDELIYSEVGNEVLLIKYLE